MVSTIVRFVLTLAAGLTAFYLAAHGMFLLGLADRSTVAGVDAFYAMILRPLTSLDPSVHNTLLSLTAAAAVQLAILYHLFRRWSYRADDRTAPVAAGARPADWNARSVHTAAAADNGVAAEPVEPTPAAVAAQVPQAEYDRLLGLLRRQD